MGLVNSVIDHSDTNKVVSIIIPVYNRENYISNTLQSILAQSYKNWECIIVDDHSTDRTIEIIEGFVRDDSRFKLMVRPNEIKKGANGCRNYGYENSIGYYLNWFDSDDLMHPDFLFKKVTAFNSEESLDIVLSKTIKVEIEGKKNFEQRTIVTDNLLEDYITRKVSWYLPDAMIKKKFIVESSLFDDDLKGGQDRDFYIKQLIRKPKIKILDFYATLYLIHTQSISEKLYRSKDRNESNLYGYSHFLSLINQVVLLDKNNLLSDSLKKHYFIEIKKKMPNVLYFRKGVKIYYKKLVSLSFCNSFYISQWLKILLASMTYILFGKGEKILK